MTISRRCRKCHFLFDRQASAFSWINIMTLNSELKASKPEINTSKYNQFNAIRSNEMRDIKIF